MNCDFALTKICAKKIPLQEKWNILTAQSLADFARTHWAENDILASGRTAPVGDHHIPLNVDLYGLSRLHNHDNKDQNLRLPSWPETMGQITKEQL